MERVLACPCQIENESHKAGFIPATVKSDQSLNVAVAQVQ